MRLTVTGIGHLGLVHAACMAELGHEVLGMDNDPDKVKAANAADPWFREPQLEDLLKKHTASGKLRFTSSAQETAEFADAHFLCVPTPGREDGSADLSYLRKAVSALAQHMTGRNLIIGKSTVPPGTARKLQLLARATEGNQEIEVAWNPEFLSESTAVDDTLYPDRLVFGAESEWAQEVLRQAYDPLIRDMVYVMVTDLATAELSKLASNAFLAMKISFVNGMARMAGASGADPVEVARIAGFDGRIGTWGTQPGLGYGGGCLPKDVRMLKTSAERAGLCNLPHLLGSVAEINRSQRLRAAQVAWQMLGTVKGKRIAVLGLSFKPGTSDVRDSPSLDVIAALRKGGATVVSHDPEAVVRDVGQVAGDSSEAMKDADLVIVCTAWPEYKEIEPADFAAAKIIDARYALDREKWESCGWQYRTLD